jgi:methylglutaconyl-CoA hydratase
VSGHAPLAAEGTVSTVVSRGIGDVCFGHPKSNSLPATVLSALAETITTLGDRDDIGVIVLRSYGAGAFCAGASFDELRAIRDAAAGREFFMGFARVILAMTRCPKPVVTRVQGKVVGGGVGIVAASDYVFAVERASLRLSELAVGIGPFVVGPVVEYRIGSGAFTAMALDADWRDASWAERHGLYARVLADLGALDNAVDAFAAELTTRNPDAVSAIKAAAWRTTKDWPDLLAERAAVSGRLVLSEFTKNALNAAHRP